MNKMGEDFVSQYVTLTHKCFLESISLANKKPQVIDRDIDYVRIRAVFSVDPKNETAIKHILELGELMYITCQIIPKLKSLQ